MNSKIRGGLRAMFGIHMVIAYLLGLGYMLIPAQMGAWFSVDMSDPIWRVFGTALIGLGFSSMMALRAHEWKEVQILVELEVVWPTLGALVTLYLLMTDAYPASGWINFAIMAFLAIGFGYFLFTVPRSITERDKYPTGGEMMQH